MQSRIEYMKIAPGAMKTMYGLEKYLAECGLEPQTPSRGFAHLCPVWS